MPISGTVHIAGVLGFLLLVWAAALLLDALQRRHRRAAFLLWGMGAAYLAVYFWLTLGLRMTDVQPQINLTPFWSYAEAFVIRDGALRIRRLGLARQILLNVLVYVPLGCVLPCILRRSAHPYRWTLLAGFGLSLLTELLQLLTRRGLCELDDLLHNSLGCLLGIAALALGRRLLGRIRRRANGKSI